MDLLPEYLWDELTGPFVFDVSDDDISKPEVILELSWFIQCLKLPRRKIPDWLDETITTFEGTILTPDGMPLDVREFTIEDYFTLEEESFKWLENFQKYISEPWKQKPQAKVLPRLRMIRLAYQIGMENGRFSKPSEDDIDRLNDGLSKLEDRLLVYQIKKYMRHRERISHRLGN